MEKAHFELNIFYALQVPCLWLVNQLAVLFFLIIWLKDKDPMIAMIFPVVAVVLYQLAMQNF
jgi:hypothetical protein